MKFLLVLLLFSGWHRHPPAADFPQADIANGIITASLYLPDNALGYYRATRFDWAGVVKSLAYKKHSFFGQWFKKYDPFIHDAISGPAEEFEPLGYNDAKPGDKFIKIGVGALRRANEKPYSSFTLYEMADPGTWKVEAGKDRVVFTQELKDQQGYAYVYRKTVRLMEGKPVLVLEHSLKNTGTRKLETDVYDHNFIVIDQQPTGPAIKIKFPFDVHGTGRGLGTIGEIRGREISYLRTLADNESMFINPVSGFQNSKTDYDFRIENHQTGAGVRITGDQPLSRMVFWACATTSCPEPYIHVQAAPGQEFTWKISYEFYEFSR